MTFITPDLTSKINKVPDYDSGCFSLAASSYIEKTHNLNSRALLVSILYGGTDTDCIADGTSGAGRPMYDMSNSVDTYTLYVSSVNNVELLNQTGATKYFRILIWKVG